MKLKLDETGNAVIVEGKPIYVYDDGKEIPFDAESAIKKISNLTEEKSRHYAKYEEAAKKLERFGDMDPEAIQEKMKVWSEIDLDEAREAIATVANLKDGDLVRAGQVEQLKAEMKKAYVEKEREIHQSWERKATELNSTIEKKNKTIHELMVTSRFASSPTILKKTILPPDIAATYFERNFRVEGDESNVRVVGYTNNGERIFSKERPGELADFEEAINVIIDSYPMKDQILRGSPGGSGSAGNLSGSRSDERDRLRSLGPTERLKQIHKQSRQSAGGYR